MQQAIVALVSDSSAAQAEADTLIQALEAQNLILVNA